MTREELDKLLGEWEKAVHNGVRLIGRMPPLVAAALIDTGDKLADALKEMHEQRRRGESAGKRGETRD